MRFYFKLILIAAAAGVQPATAAESAIGALSCRSQAVFQCDKACEEANQPADISLDFAAKTGSFCRGEQCNDAALASMDIKGQWDDKAYTAFMLVGDAKSPFKVVGSISADHMFFSAVSDEIGNLAGSCEPAGQ